MTSEMLLPARSTFAHLKPVGLGTGQVESFDGYLWRLAQVHSVSLQAIKTYALEGSEMTRSKATSKRADLPSVVNVRLRAALPTLTLVPDSGRLGLGGMYGRLGQNFVLRKRRCWCPDCIAEMGPDNRYWPLVWNLEGYSYCSRHRMPVATRCPSCSRRFDLTSDWLPFDGACPNCKADVCQAAADGAQGESSAAEIALSSALEQFSADVANIPAVTKPGRDFALNRTIDHARNTGEASSLTEVASIAGMTPLFFDRLRREGGALPNLSVLGRLSIATGVPIAGILYEPLWRSDSIRLGASALSSLSFANGGQKRDFMRIVTDAREALDRGEGIPLTQLAARHGVTPSSARAALGAHLVLRLKEAAAHRREMLERQQFEELVSSMAVVCRDMRAEGESLVAAAVARKLQRFGEHRYFMQAFQLALERSASAR